LRMVQAQKNRRQKLTTIRANRPDQKVVYHFQNFSL
jgi:hypothetical protein